jgi:ABC-type multidrug transport system fused ATPase/permease subunit
LAEPAQSSADRGLLRLPVGAASPPAARCDQVACTASHHGYCHRRHEEAHTMLASTYPILDIFWTMLEIFLFFIWIYLIFVVFLDIFRSHDLGGLAKALWVIGLIIFPFLGVFIYLIARGGKMHERAAQAAQAQQQAFNAYVQETAGTSSADQLAKLADLKEKGALTEEEFAAQKAKILG